MKVNQSKAVRIALLGAIACLSQIAGAISLGPITVNSHIGEPLKASISVSGLTAAEAANTTVQLADSAAYRAKGIKKLPSHDALQMSLVPSGSKYAIVIRSNEQIREPFINFVLDIDSAGEETVREYAVFLDPAPSAISGLSAPGLGGSPQVQRGQAAAVQPGNATAANNLLAVHPATAADKGWQGNRKAAQATSLSPPTHHSETHGGGWQGRKYGPVRKGETLFGIAEKVRPSTQYSMQTVMRQIFAANRHAFANNNLNSLMAGYVLTIPEFKKGSVTGKATKKPQPQPVDAVVSADGAAVGDVDAAEKDGGAQPTIAQEKQTATEPTLPADSQTDSDASQAVTAPDSEQTNAAMPQHQNENEDAFTATFIDSLPDNIDQPSEPLISETEYTAQAATDQDTVEQPTEILVEQGNDGATEIVVEKTEQLPPVSSADGNTDVDVVEEQTTVPEVLPVDNTPVAQTDLVEQDTVYQEEPSFLTTTYAILPMWQWLLIAFLVFFILAVLLYRSRQKKGDGDGVLDQEEMDAVLAQLNEFEEEDAHSADTHHAAGVHGEEQGAKQDATATAVADEQDGGLFDPHADEFDALFDDSIEHDEPHTDHVDAVAEDAPVADLLDSSELVHDDADAEEDFDFFLDSTEEENQAVDPVDESTFMHHSDQPELSDTPTRTEEAKATDTDATDFSDYDFLFEEDVDEDSAGEDHGQADAPQPIADVRVEEGQKESPSAAATTPENIDWFDELKFDDEDDRGDVEKTTATPVAHDAPASGSTSIEEMEINLDLAASFIATGHGDRAIAWLEEVIETGTEDQKARATELIHKARGD